MISFTSFTNLSSATPWGLWVVLYVWLIGISTGSAVVVAHGLLFKKQYAPHITRLGLLLSLTTLAAGAASINLDLGHMERGLSMVTSLNWTSPMVWALRLYALFFILLTWALLSLRKGKGIISALLAIFIGTVALAITIDESLLFALPPGKDWHTPLLPLLFFCSSLALGASGLVAVGSILLKGEKGQSMLPLCKAAAVFLFVNAALEIVEGVISSAILSLPLAGPIVLQVLAGILLFKPSAGRITFASGLALLSIFFSKYVMVVSVQLHEPFKGFARAFSEPRLQFTYAPSVFEVTTVVLIVALSAGALVYLYKHFQLTREN